MPLMRERVRYGYCGKLVYSSSCRVVYILLLVDCKLFITQFIARFTGLVFSKDSNLFVNLACGR